MKKRETYIKNVEDLNDKLDDNNYKLNIENNKLKEEIKMVREACMEFERCLSLLLEKYPSDSYINQAIMNTLKITTKKLLKK